MTQHHDVHVVVEPERHSWKVAQGRRTLSHHRTRTGAVNAATREARRDRISPGARPRVWPPPSSRRALHIFTNYRRLLFRPTFVPFCEHRDLVDCAAGDDVQDFLVGTRKGQVVGIP